MKANEVVKKYGIAHGSLYEDKTPAKVALYREGWTVVLSEGLNRAIPTPHKVNAILVHSEKPMIKGNEGR